MQNLNKSILKRLIFIDNKINLYKYVKTKSLSDEYEVSEKTIYRDFEMLKELFDAPVKYDYKRKAFYYDGKFNLRPFSFSQTELHALAVLREMLKSLKSNPFKSSQKILYEKLKLIFGEEIEKLIDIVKDKISFRFHPTGKINPKIFSKIEEALFDEKCMEIHYLKPGNDYPIKRIINPYHLRNYDGVWYLIGFEHNRKKVRMLNAGKIVKVRLTNTYFDIPDDFDIDSYFKFSFGKRRSSKIYNVILEIEKVKSETILDRGFSLPFKLINLKNGNKRMVFEVNELKELSEWILKDSEGIKIIQPIELINILKLKAKSILNIHK